MLNRSPVLPLAFPLVGIIALLGGLVAPSGRAAAQASRAAAQQRSMVVEAFVRAGSHQCEQIRPFLADLRRRRPGLRIIVRDVAENASDLERLKTLARHFGVEPRVPTVYAGQQLIVGFRDAATTGRQIEDTLRVLVFTREGCPRCAQARPYINGLAQRYPGLSVEIYEVTRDANARAWWERLMRQQGIQAPGLPTFHLCGRSVVGYSGWETTGAQIEALLQAASVPVRPSPDVAPAARAPSAGANGSASRLAPGVLLTGFQLPPPRSEGDLPAEADLPPEAELPPKAEESGIPYGPGVRIRPERGPPPETIRVPVLGRLHVRDLGMPLFTFLIGLVDGFNPCAMWVLVFLLSVLVNLQDRRKIVLIAGTFVVISGLVYYAFMAAWLNVFLLIGFARPAQVILGLMGVFIGVVNVKDFFAFRRGLSLSIPESVKPGIYARVREVVSAQHLSAALTGAIVLALLVNTVELLCTAGLPALYTQILTYRNYPLWVNYLYLGLYILAYMLDDAIVLTIVVVTLSRHRLQEREGRWLKLVSGAVILGLGLVMLFQPEWLI